MNGPETDGGGDLEALREAVAKDPGSVAARRRLALALLAAERLLEAAGACRDLLRLAPDDAAAWCNLGHVLRLLGRLEPAAGACRRAIRLDPDLVPAHTNLGAALLAAGEAAAALAAFDAARALAPGDPDALGNVALARRALGEPEAALALLARAVEGAPGNLPLLRARGWMEMGLGQWDAARATFLEAMTLLSGEEGESAPARAPRPYLDPEARRLALLAAKGVLEAREVEFFLTYGTLLGLVRDGGFIAHDSDIDLGIRPGAPKAALVEGLAAAGFAYTGEQPPATAINLPFTHAAGAVVELYEHWEADGRCLSGFELGGARLLWAFSPFGLARREWLGTGFSVPDDTERYLSEGYGDWRRPERHFEATFWAPNILGGFPPIARAFAYLRTLDRLRDGDFEAASAHLDRIVALEGPCPELIALRDSAAGRRRA